MKNAVIAAVVVILVIIAGAGYFLFREPEAASGPMQAVPIDQSSASAASQPTEAATEPAATQAVEPSPTELAETETTEPETTDAPASSEPAATAQLFEIVANESEARFVIEEVLRGADVTVVGKTSMIAGQIEINPSDLSSTRLGVIQVNARDIATDNNMRNRAIKNFILDTNTFEFVTFTPVELVGLPASASVGDTVNFQIVGDLTIKDVTKRVTFDAQVTAVSETRVEGSASTSFPYRDFNLAIPDAPMVDTVADDVKLEIDFVATAL
jgi:polyisoprenoid-binding protein YceI